MSGGSFNYLCQKYEMTDLFHAIRDLQSMADELAKCGHTDAARETQELILNLRQAENRIETSAQRLRSVWKAMEWMCSADWGEEPLKEALREYRGEAPD